MSRLDTMWKGRPAWIVPTVSGGLIGMVLAIGGGMRTRFELLPGEQPPFGLGMYAVFGAVAGTVGGVVYWATGSFRKRGSWRFFLAWILTVLVGTGVGLSPGLLFDPSLSLYVIWLVVGTGAGIGLALTERITRRGW